MNIKSIFHRTSATASTQESGTCNLTRRKLLGVTGAMLAAQPLLALSSSVRAACMPSSAPEGEGKAAIPTPLSGHYPWQKFDLDIAYGPKMPQGCQLIQINDQPCGPEIRLKKGDIFYTTVRNRMKEPTTVHWHGILVPNLMDGVPNVSQVPLPQGVETTYSWPVVQGGTYWYHSHFGLQDQQGLAGPLILEDPDEPFVYDKEAVLFMEDRLSADPYQVLDALQHKPAPEAAIAPTLPPKEAVFPYPGGKKFGVDVQYTRFPLNGCLPEKPFIVEAKPGERIRLRVINGSSSSYFCFSVQGHELQVIAKDGNIVQPLASDAILMATAERYDALITAGKPGIYRIVGEAVGQTTGALAILRVGDVALPAAFAVPTPADSIATRAQLRLADAWVIRSMLPTTMPDVPQERIAMRLNGDMKTYHWSINGEFYPDAAPVDISQKRRVVLEVINETMMYHPMHLHGHFFRVLDPHMRDANHSALMDTISVPPMAKVALEFYSDNPGRWVFHCHNMYHMVSGMLRVIQYRATE